MKNKKKPQMPPLFQSDTELSGPDEPKLKDVLKTLCVLTTTLAATNAKVDSLTTHGVPQVSAPEEHPGSSWPSDVENSPAATSIAKPDQASMEEQAQIWVTHRMRSSYPSFLAIIDDKSDREEEEHPQLRRTKITSGKLRTADTTAIK